MPEATEARTWGERDLQFETKPVVVAIEGGRVNSSEPEPANAGFDPRNQHPEYRRLSEAWQTARDVYEGAEALVERAESYVPQRTMGEAKSAYEERLALLYFDGLLGALVDMIVGLWARKPPEEDEWGILGTVDAQTGVPQEGTVAYKLFEDADRCGTRWENHRRIRATDMIVFRQYLSYVDTNKTAETPTTSEGETTREMARMAGVRPYINRIQPLDFLDWFEEDGRLIECVVREHVDSRKGLDDGKGKIVDQYLRFELSGWTRYQIQTDDQGQEQVVVVGAGTYTYVDDMGLARLPVVRRELPSPRYGAYNLARIVIGIINHDSHLDSMLRAAAIGQFLAAQGDREELKEAIQVGDKVLAYPAGAQPPQFVSYMTEAAESIKGRIENLTARFWKSAMYEFTDRARETTATEIEQQWAAGVGSFLTLLSGTCEEAENEEKDLLAQASRPGTPGVPFNADTGFTSFATDFKVEDTIAELQRLKDLVFGAGGGLTLTPALEAAVGSAIMTKLQSTLGIVEGDDIDVEAELLQAADEKKLERERMQGLRQEMGSKPGFPEEDEG